MRERLGMKMDPNPAAATKSQEKAFRHVFNAVHERRERRVDREHGSMRVSLRECGTEMGNDSGGGRGR